MSDKWTYGIPDGYQKPVIICIIDGKRMLQGEATMYLIEEKGYSWEEAFDYIAKLPA